MRLLLTILALIAAACIPFSCQSKSIHVGSKAFTGSVILGELASKIVDPSGKTVVHHAQLGGTRLVYESIKNGEINVYPEYTGTLANEIFAEELDKSKPIPPQIETLLDADGLIPSRPLGFSDNYALGMNATVAEQLGVNTISDLKRHPELIFRFGNEFMERVDDGWPGLKERYGLPQNDVKGMDHDLAYRQIKDGVIHLMDVYTMDAKIRSFNIRVLEDDLGFFPKYEALFLYRKDFAKNNPDAIEQILKLEGAISPTKMLDMNQQADENKDPESTVAARFLESEFRIIPQTTERSRWDRISLTTIEHLDLVRQSLIAAILVAIPLGVIAARVPSAGQLIIGFAGIMQTVPGLALLVILIQPVNALGLGSVGQGSVAVVIALFLYSLLPIIRNTYTGLQSIPAQLTEVSESLGLSPFAKLRLIDLPMASPMILAGIKTAAVMNVGFATLGAFIGAGGYGQPILTGIRRNDYGMILEGAIPAAIFALATQAIFELSERWLVPKGLRMKGGE